MLLCFKEKLNENQLKPPIMLTLYGPNSLFFRRFFGTLPKIGSFRLPTHRRDAHRKFF